MVKFFLTVGIFLILSTLLEAGKLIVINLTTQEAYAYEDGNLVMSGEVSTGKPGHRTPKGKFKILEKKKRHVSSKYPEPNGGARMDYMMRLTYSGIAMHLGYVPNYPASHGCIRLKNGFAQRLYRWASVGTPVIIKGNPPVRVSRKKKRRGLASAEAETLKPLSKPQTQTYYPEDTLEYHPIRRASLNRAAVIHAGSYTRRVLHYDDRYKKGPYRSRIQRVGYRYPPRRVYKRHTRDYIDDDDGLDTRFIYDYHKGKRFRRKVIELDDLAYD
jgi:hypothetical protein